MAPAAPPKPDPKDAHPRDPFREAVETVVFVVVLVLLLKLFVTEAFVIPTGSMAETLYGYQKVVVCPQCGHSFPVNANSEVEGDPNTRERSKLIGYTCPNCRHHGDFESGDVPAARSGDRVLVLKPLYELQSPKRGDVVVFKYPERPEDREHRAQNYIKRAMGFGGETVAIFHGELFTTKALTFAAEAGTDPLDLWKPGSMYKNNPAAVEKFEQSRAAGFPGGVEHFEIVRKPDSQVLADERIVWDNDHQPKGLKGQVPARWAAAGGGWKADDAAAPLVFTHDGAGLDWVRYQHLAWFRADATEGNVGTLVPWAWPLMGLKPEPGPVYNSLGYNAGVEVEVRRIPEGFPPYPAPRRFPPVDFVTEREPLGPDPRFLRGVDRMWVGDLILECEAEVGDPAAEVVLELSKGVNRYQAKFAGGNVTLSRTGPGAKEYASRPSGITKGTYSLRFANVDCRLRVWVDNRRIDFGTDGDYPPEFPEVANGDKAQGWTNENDRDAPASVGAAGPVTVRHLVLGRDIYYGQNSNTQDFASPETYYVQPGHYMCLGDNSAQSSDSRTWGTVPERLLLGKAVFVFWPFYPSPNRTGFIK